MVYTKVYYDGISYKGSAIVESSRLDFLKWYTVEESRDMLLQTIETAISNRGLTPLKVEIEYSETTLYHVFNATYYSYDKTQSQNTSPKFIPLIPLLPAIITLLTIIAVGIVVYSVLTKIEEIIYNPADDNESQISSVRNIIMVGIVLFGTAMLIKELTPLVKEVKPMVTQSKTPAENQTISTTSQNEIVSMLI